MPNYILEKKQVKDDCLIYNFSDTKTNDKLSYFVNWSNKSVTHIIKNGMQSNWLLQEYFGSTLYSTTLDDKDKIFTNTQKPQGITELQLKPYSITVLSTDE